MGETEIKEYLTGFLVICKLSLLFEIMSSVLLKMFPKLQSKIFSRVLPAKNKQFTLAANILDNFKFAEMPCA